MVEERIFWRRKGQGSWWGRDSVAVATGQRRGVRSRRLRKRLFGGQRAFLFFLLLFQVGSWEDIEMCVGGGEEMIACDWSIQKHLDSQK